MGWTRMGKTRKMAGKTCPPGQLACCASPSLVVVQFKAGRRYSLRERGVGLYPFRILTFNGGGIRGAFGVAFLARLEELTGTPVVDHFDLIAGTSTGAIIAASLALGLPASQLERSTARTGEKSSTREPYRARGVMRPIYPLASRVLRRRTGQGMDSFFRAPLLPLPAPDLPDEGLRETDPRRPHPGPGDHPHREPLAGPGAHLPDAPPAGRGGRPRPADRRRPPCRHGRADLLPPQGHAGRPRVLRRRGLGERPGGRRRGRGDEDPPALRPARLRPRLRHVDDPAPLDRHGPHDLHPQAPGADAGRSTGRAGSPR